jgi:hypothetical protein
VIRKNHQHFWNHGTWYNPSHLLLSLPQNLRRPVLSQNVLQINYKDRLTHWTVPKLNNFMIQRRKYIFKCILYLWYSNSTDIWISGLNSKLSWWMCTSFPYFLQGLNTPFMLGERSTNCTSLLRSQIQRFVFLVLKKKYVNLIPSVSRSGNWSFQTLYNSSNEHTTYSRITPTIFKSWI